MIDERCHSCRFWHPDHAASTLGNCRRHAPVVTGDMMSDVTTVWPRTDSLASCGDWAAVNYRRPA